MSEVIETQIIDANGNELTPGGGKKPIDKKDMIKNVAIGFLSVMLVLTFFSNTIMNYSLPQVATQMVSSGSISPQIRGTGTVTSEDPYNVTVKETRKISGVAIKEGDHVEKDDVIYYLEDKESDELVQAREDLETKELAYEQALFSGNVPDDVISRVRSGGSTSYDAYQIQLKEINDKYNNAKAVSDAATKAVNYLEKLKSYDTNEISYNTASYAYEDAYADYQIALIEANDDLTSEEKTEAEKYWKEVKTQNTKEKTELTTYSSQIATSYDQKLLEAKENQTNAQKILEDVEEEKTKLLTSINTEISLCDQRDKIKEQKEKIAKLEAESVGASVKAPVSGIVSSLPKKAGESISADETIAVIQIDGKDLTTSFSVTNQQAQKLQVGDIAKPQNAWMYSDDFKAILTSIKNDKSDPANKKTLTFKIESSEVTTGQSIALAIGERSVSYDMIVPNSAIKTGNTGKFILVVTSKSSPLGNRYIASSVEVNVLASDDNYSAISAALNGDEFVITTSNKPVKAGEQVRLASE